MMNQLNEIVKKVESGFCEPEYLDVKIRYVKRENKSDFCISKKHNLDDYIVMGVFLLYNSVIKKRSEINVFCKSKLAKEEIKVRKSGQPCQEEVLAESELFLQIYKPLDEIYAALYKDEYKLSMVGLTISTLLMTQFAGADVIPKEFVEGITFECFDDKITAQKNIFGLMKKITASSVAGIFCELGND